jgi:hypothetical protein
VVVTARIAYARAADSHIAGWATERLVAITSFELDRITLSIWPHSSRQRR